MSDEHRDEPEALLCSSCGAPLHIESVSQDFVTCEYCGTSFSVSDLLDESDEVRAARIQAKTQTGAPTPPPAPKRAKRMSATTATVVKTTVLAVCAAMLAFIAAASFAMSAGAGLVALLQMALFLFVMYLVLTKKKPAKATLMSIGAIVLAVVLVVPWAGAINGSSYSSSYEHSAFDWDSLALAGKLPACDKNTGYIYSNSSSRLSLEVGGVSEAEYSAYVSACQQAGYTIEPEMLYGDYSAFNEEGYELELGYYDYDSEMDIRLTAPKPMSTLVWPSGTIADTVPKPEASEGYLETASTRMLTVYVDGMSKEDVHAYRQACIDAGYSNVETMDDTTLRATDDAGRELRVSYEGNQVVLIDVYAAS